MLIVWGGLIVGVRAAVAGVSLAVVAATGILAPASPAVSDPLPAGRARVAEPDYRPDPQSLARHRTPQWFKDAKLGFFIHWGPYSVPAFAPDGGGARPGSDVYAEWYWYEMNHPGSPTNRHHAETYGEDFPYDRFVEQWRADRFNPREWLDLFTEGGAKYFVMVSKHHDGVALWDTATTDRDTVALGPHRDFIRELFDAAADYPLKKGLYYSLAEWYHPDGGWDPPQHSLKVGPVNPYTGQPVPYTGYLPIDDDVLDHQYPQMLELVDRFDPDLMWCDIGQHVPNNSLELMAHYYNQAKNRTRPKEVVVNDRCGPDVHDFVTREYRNQPDIDPNPWEATRGIGRSFGYNAQEDVEDYLTDAELIHSFVDTVSKNGNLLLNIGPKADGSIPDIQAARVRALGRWLDINGEAIYGSTYWQHADDPKSEVPVRYTVQDDAIYATALAWPGERLTLSGALPLRADSRITLLGSDGTPLRWQRENGVLTIEMPAEGAAATRSEHAYTFKISTRGAHQVAHTSMDVPAQPEPGQPISAEVTVTNPGPKSTTVGRVVLDIPAGWTADPPSTVLPKLAPGESRTLRFAVTPAAGAPARRYLLTATITLGSMTYQPADSILLSDLVRVVSPEKLNQLEVAEVGARPYVDRNLRVTELPPQLQGQLLVPGANDDKQRQPGPMSIVDGRVRVAGGGVTLAKEGAQWTDYRFELTVRPTTRGAGWMFRSPDRNNGYMWQLYPGTGLTPHILENGSFRKLTNTIPLPVTAGQDYRVRMELDGATIRTFVDGELVDERVDTTFSSGTVGFREASNEVGEFDDVLVTDAATGATLLADDFSAGLSQWDNDTMAEYLVLDLARDARVWVAFDQRGAPEAGNWWPSWLGELGFQRTELTVRTNDPSGTTMVVLTADLPAGRVALGPNAATSSQATSYFTIVAERGAG
jgi:alpha-L-fucosidase